MLFYNWDNPAFEERNEMVFADRNMLYGAFQIRKEYSRRVIMAFVITGAVFVILLLALWLPAMIRGGEAPPREEIIVDVQEINKEEKKEEPPPPEVEPPKEKIIELVAFVPPVIKDEAKEDTTKIIDQDKVEDKNISNVNQKGDDELVVETKTVTVVEEKKEEIFVYVSEMPEFPGGIQALYKYVGSNINYPETAKEAGISGKCFLRFVVTAEGKVGKVEVQKGVPGCPECDKEATRVVRGLPEFKPGKNNGSAVPVWFQLPINFTLK